MDTQKKVSVIMPVYNVEDYLEQCLDSVLAQTLREIEVICVDDGSTDSSGVILEKYQEKDERIRVFHQQNQFAGCARNLGLKHASGKYVIFWDSDDFFDRDALKKLYEKCEEDRAQIGVCGANRMDNASGLVYPSGFYVVKKMLPDVRPFSKKDIPQYLFNFTTNVPWNKMFLREFLLEHQLEFQPLRQANDVYFSMTALFFGERITVVPEALVTYRMDNTSSLTGKASESRFCTAQAYEAVWERLSREPEFDTAVRRSFANRALDALLYSLRTQWNIQVYQELFELYKGRLLEEFDISGHEAEFYYSEQNYADLQQMLLWDFQSFLLYDFRSYERRFKNTGGKLALAKNELAELKKENKRLKKLEESSSYKVGKMLLYLPGKLKKIWKRAGR